MTVTAVMVNIEQYTKKINNPKYNKLQNIKIDNHSLYLNSYSYNINNST